MLRTTLVAAMASLAVVGCSKPTPPADAPPTGRIGLYVAAPEDRPAVQPCIDAAVAFNTNRRPDGAERLGQSCDASAKVATVGPCRDWASNARRAAFKFSAGNLDSPIGREGLGMALADTRAAALACNAAA